MIYIHNCRVFREKRKKIVIVTFGVIKVTKSQASMLLFSNYRLVMLRTSLRLELLKTHWLLHSVGIWIKVHGLGELSICFCGDLRFQTFKPKFESKQKFYWCKNHQKISIQIAIVFTICASLWINWLTDYKKAEKYLQTMRLFLTYFDLFCYSDKNTLQIFTK